MWINPCLDLNLNIRCFLNSYIVSEKQPYSLPAVTCAELVEVACRTVGVPKLHPEGAKPEDIFVNIDGCDYGL